MSHLLRFVFSRRYRRLGRVRQMRRERNADRLRRHFVAVKAKLTADYIAAEDYTEARELMFLLMKLEIVERTHYPR